MQTAVASAPDFGVPGDLADLHSAQNASVSEAVNEEASTKLPFGLMVKLGSAARKAKKLTALTETLYGVAVRAHEYAQEIELDASGVKSGCKFGVLTNGRAIVAPEDAVTKASGVYVRCVDGDGGQLAGGFSGAPILNALTVADKTFTAANTDIVTANGHGLETGDGPLFLTTTDSDLPDGLAIETPYWVIKINANTFYFAASLADAIAGDRVDISDAGTGTHTLSDKAQTFTAATTDICTANGHGLLTGDAVTVSNAGGALPTGLSAATTYFVIKIDADTFYLATSWANAIAGTRIDITGAGTGTHTILGGTKRLVSRNLSKFAKWQRSADARTPTVLELKMTNAELVTL